MKLLPAPCPTFRDLSPDIHRDGNGEDLELRIPETRANSRDVTVPEARKRERHLSPFFRKPDSLNRSLCGHEERDWFVAAVPGGALGIAETKEALESAPVQVLQSRLKIPNRLRERRSNTTFTRQGEWFFVPVEEGFRLPIDEQFVLRNEPIRRGKGKAPIVAELYREQGEVVYHHPRYPNGMAERQYRHLVQAIPGATRWPWQIQRRNPRVYARGAVSHPDHITIWLQGWHRVLMNAESETDSNTFLIRRNSF